MKINKQTFLTIAFALVYTLSIAQTVKLNVSNEETTMTVTGTSTLHDWTSEVNTVSGHVELGEKLLKKSKVKSDREFTGGIEIQHKSRDIVVSRVRPFGCIGKGKWRENGGNFW